MTHGFFNKTCYKSEDLLNAQCPTKGTLLKPLRLRLWLFTQQIVTWKPQKTQLPTRSALCCVWRSLSAHSFVLRMPGEPMTLAPFPGWRVTIKTRVPDSALCYPLFCWPICGSEFQDQGWTVCAGFGGREEEPRLCLCHLLFLPDSFFSKQKLSLGKLQGSFLKVNSGCILPQTKRRLLSQYSSNSLLSSNNRAERGTLERYCNTHTPNMWNLSFCESPKTLFAP